MSGKGKFPFYLSPEKKAILERRYQEDGSRSMTAFVERAVDFYLDYLSANDAGLFLPTSIKSYLDGRLGQLEERLSSLAFRQAVEQAENYAGLEIIDVADYQDAVSIADSRAVEGDVVILSPASTSFDRFANFMERGRVFKEIVNALP